jgi:catechol 2,3-dioxygenase-like lactoylglutathione lyase family enzyme
MRILHTMLRVGDLERSIRFDTEVPDAAAACAEIRRSGGVVTREAGPMKHGTTVIAFVQGPDGCTIELIQRSR